MEQMDRLNGCNLYAYCLNNPVMETDPEGTFIFAILFGFVIGALISGAVEVDKQLKENGGDWSKLDWGQVGMSALGGGVAGAVSAIPLFGFCGSLVFGGAGNLLGGLISGSVTDLNTGIQAFAIGAIANGIGYGIGKGLTKFKTNKIGSLGGKAKSAAVWQLKGIEPSSLSKGVRYAYKNISNIELEKMVTQSISWLRNGIFSSITSSGLSSLLW